MVIAGGKTRPTRRQLIAPLIGYMAFGAYWFAMSALRYCRLVPSLCDMSGFLSLWSDTMEGAFRELSWLADHYFLYFSFFCFDFSIFKKGFFELIWQKEEVCHEKNLLGSSSKLIESNYIEKETLLYLVIWNIFCFDFVYIIHFSAGFGIDDAERRENRSTSSRLNGAAKKKKKIRLFRSHRIIRKAGSYTEGILL